MILVGLLMGLKWWLIESKEKEGEATFYIVDVQSGEKLQTIQTNGGKACLVTKWVSFCLLFFQIPQKRKFGQ